MHVKRGSQRRVGIHNTLETGCVPSSMYMEDPGTVVARSCHQRGVDEKIWDASPIRDSVNPEAEIGRPHTTIA